MQRNASHQRALLIDAMGTLVKLEPPAPALRGELAHRFGIEVSLAQVQRAVAAEIAYYRAHMQDGRDAAGVQELHRRCAEALRTRSQTAIACAGSTAHRSTAALLASLRFRSTTMPVPRWRQPASAASA